MPKSVKIFELKGADWMKGLSSQATVPVGGIFSSAVNFDPFEISGMMQPSLTSAVASNSSITNTPVILTSWQDSGTAKLYAHSHNKLYEVLDGSPYTTVDKTAQISVATNLRGAIIYKNRYIYCLTNQVRSNVFPVASGSDTQIYTSIHEDHWHPFCVGADKNLYMGDIASVHRINSISSLDNGGLDKVTLEDSMHVRHLINDGRYLVILADNNSSGDTSVTGGSNPSVPIAGRYRCQVLFWDMVKSTFEQIYEFYDSYLVGGVFLDGGVYVFGGDNLYVCNIVTPPKAIFNFRSGSTITEKPQNPFQIISAKNSIHWCGQTNGAIYSYGSIFPGMKRVFSEPYQVGDTPSAITFNGTNFYVGTNGTNAFLKVLNTGTTRNTATIATAPVVLPQPFSFDYIKVVLQSPMASGDSVDAFMVSQNNSRVISAASNTKSYSTDGAKQTLVFRRKPNGGTNEVTVFEDFQLGLSTNKAIAHVEVWATPLENHLQVL